MKSLFWLLFFFGKTAVGNIHSFKFDLTNALSIFEEKQGNDVERDVPAFSQCVLLSGVVSNLFAFEFLQGDRVEAICGHESFKNEQQITIFAKYT